MKVANFSLLIQTVMNVGVPHSPGLGFSRLQSAVLGKGFCSSSTARSKAQPSPPVVRRRQMLGIGEYRLIFSMPQSSLKPVGKTSTLRNSLVMRAVSLTDMLGQGNISTLLPRLSKTYLNNLHKIQICMGNSLMSQGLFTVNSFCEWEET